MHVIQYDTFSLYFSAMLLMATPSALDSCMANPSLQRGLMMPDAIPAQGNGLI